MVERSRFETFAARLLPVGCPRRVTFSRGRRQARAAAAVPLGRAPTSAKLLAHARTEAPFARERLELLADELGREEGEHVEDTVDVAAGAVAAVDAGGFGGKECGARGAACV